MKVIAAGDKISQLKNILKRLHQVKPDELPKIKREAEIYINIY